jgi:transcriptional regulator with XRE-family HTH domain
MVDHIYVAETGPTALGALVRDARKRAGFSQAELAREMTLRGYEITREAIASIEAGNVDLPSKETLRGFNAVLGLSRARLLEAAEWLDSAEAAPAALIEELQAERRSLSEVLERVDRLLSRLEPGAPIDLADRRRGEAQPESTP